MVEKTLDDYKNTDLSEREIAMLGFVQKLNRLPLEIKKADILELKKHDWSDAAIYDAVTVSALFNFYNRWVDATGVLPLSEAKRQSSGKYLAEYGYSAKS